MCGRIVDTLKIKGKLLSLFLAIVLIASIPLSALALHGDVNNDECIGLEDAIIALRYVSGLDLPTSEQKYTADVNYDGDLTTDDVRLILRGAANICDIPQHLLSQWKTVVAPTCNQTGLAKASCLYCGKEVVKTLNKIEHIIVPATCTKDSYCSVCSETFGEALGHTITDGYCTTCKTYIPYFEYKGSTMTFGCSPVDVEKALGQPKEKFEDVTTNTTFEIYVYYTDYKDLAVITFANGKLTQLYSNCPTAIVRQGDSHYGLYCKSAPSEIGEISLTTYADTRSNNFNYSFCATVGEAYTLIKATDYAVYSKLNVHLTNGLRALHNVAPVQYCEAASGVATAHSTDMATRDYFEHTTPEGVTPGTRLTNGGVKWYACGENIAAGYTDPYETINGWYNSEGHRKNILNGRYLYLGVGFAYNPNATYRYYGTQNFYTNIY